MCPAKPWGEALDVGDGGRVTKANRCFTLLKIAGEKRAVSYIYHRRLHAYYTIT